MSATTTPGASSETSVKQDTPTKVASAPNDTPNEIWTRCLILAAFWTVVVFLGLPHWIWTTSVYRAELDTDAASRWVEGKACSFRYPIHLALESDESSTARESFQQQLLRALNNDSARIHAYRWLESSHDSDKQPADFTIQLKTSASSTSATASIRTWGPDIIVDCPQLNSEGAIADCASAAANSIETTTASEQAAIAYTLRGSTYADLIKTDLGDVSELEKRSTRALKYASSYHITFSLFSASSVPSAWDVESALQRYITPLLDSLSSISNFTVDTQVQLYSSFSPSMEGPHFDEQTGAWHLSRAELSGFINAAEWPLSPSIDSGPTINFVLYIPAAERTPLLVADSSTNSWIVPQWGGVQILNLADAPHLSADHLESVMYTFADQLTALVGLPQQPTSLQLRIKALTRERIAALIVSASDTLGALIRLTQKLEQIAIPESVAQAVTSSVSDLELACQNLETGRYQNALEHARLADEAVEKAFFEPSMVGQVYFPDEHKVAVYVPLLGPMAVPLLMATIKEIKQFRQSKVKTN